MKKLFILAFALAIATSAFAQKKTTADYSGVIEKYDVATKTITINITTTDRDKVVFVSDTSLTPQTL